MNNKITLTSDKIFGIEMNLIKLLVWPIVITILGVGMIWLMVVPGVGEIRLGWNNLNEVRNKEKILLGQRSYYLSLDEEELKKNSDLVNRALLEEDNAYYLVGIIKNIALKYQYSVQSFSVSMGELGAEVPADNKDDFAKIPVNVSLVGPTEKWLELVKGMEKVMPLLSLDKYEQKNTNAGLTELDLTVSAYHFAGKTGVDMSELAVTELVLKPEEIEVINNLSRYELVDLPGEFSFGELESKEFVEYERDNPFSL